MNTAITRRNALTRQKIERRMGCVKFCGQENPCFLCRSVVALSSLISASEEGVHRLDRCLVADRGVPCSSEFLTFPPELRKVIYTTNAIESLNYQLCKVTKNRGQFPNDDAVVKLLWMAICNIEDKRARERAKERGKKAADRRASGRLVEGAVTTNWKRALEQLSIVYPERIDHHLESSWV